MNYVISSIGYVSNYNVVNTANLYNFMYLTLKEMSDTDQKDYLNKMTLILGNTFKQNLRYYIFCKFHDDSTLKHF